MRKIIFACIMILCMGLLSGCSHKTDADVSTVFVEKSGSIVSVDVETLDKEYYNAEELESYITEHVENYTSANKDTVEMKSFDAEEGSAKLIMEYDSYQDYSGFNGIELYVGSIVTAQAEGYDFDTEFNSAEENTPVTKEEVISDDDNKVAIIKANVDVRVPGTILYVSAKDTQIKEKDTVSITGTRSNEEAAPTYIIYK